MTDAPDNPVKIGGIYRAETFPAPDNPKYTLLGNVGPVLTSVEVGEMAYLQATLPDFMVERIAAAVCDMLAARKAKP